MRADPLSEPGGGTRSLTGACEVTGCHEPAYQRVVRDLGVGQAESRLVCRSHLEAALAWAAQPPPRSSLPAASARGGGIGLRPEFRAARTPPKPARPTRPPRAALPSSSGEGEATERSAAPVEAQAESPATATAGSEGVGRDLPAQEPLAESVAPAGASPPSTPEPQESPLSGPIPQPLPPVDPAAPPDRCRLFGCEMPRFSRGLCRAHEARARRQGQIDLYGLPPIDPRASLRRAQAARRKEPAPKGAPASDTEIRRSEPQERDRYAAAEARIASLSAEAIQLRARAGQLEEDGARLREQLRAEQARALALTDELRQQADRLIGQDALRLILAPAPDESLAAAALRLRLELARREGVSRG